MLGILPLVSGESAAFGDFKALQKFADENLSIKKQLIGWTDTLHPEENPVDHSLQRSLLASLPSLAHFLELAGNGKVGLSEVRRIFYLCRDQLKIMRASFRDLDPHRLAEDELIRFMARIYSAKNGRVPDTLIFIRPDWRVAEISLRAQLVNAVLSSRI